MADSNRIEDLKRRVQSDPASIAFAALAEEYRRVGRFAEAIETCKAGLQRHPSYISAHVTLGRALLEVGEYDEAREELEHVLRVAPENLAAIRGLAEIHHRHDELPEAADRTADQARFTSELPDIPPARIPVATGATAAPATASGADDRTLAALEGFLAAIVRAREGSGPAPRV
jgi:predicted Zn-dependent protease